MTDGISTLEERAALPGNAQPHVIHRHALHSIVVCLETADGVSCEADHVHIPPEGAQDDGVFLNGDCADFIIANNIGYFALIVAVVTAAGPVVCSICRSFSVIPSGGGTS